MNGLILCLWLYSNFYEKKLLVIYKKNAFFQTKHYSYRCFVIVRCIIKLFESKPCLPKIGKKEVLCKSRNWKTEKIYYSYIRKKFENNLKTFFSNFDLVVPK